MKTLPLLLLPYALLCAQPTLPVKLVTDWVKLPAGAYLGECSGVAIDQQDNVWVFHRGKAPVMKFDKSGKLLAAWTDAPVKSSHGIKIDPAGNVWTIDVVGHSVKKFSADGRLLMQIGNAGGAPGTNTSKDAFNKPTGIAFLPNGDFFVSDGYENSRVVKFNRDGEYVMHIGGTRGKGPGQFDIAHDVALDEKGRIYVADRENYRVQIFDPSGKLVETWDKVGSPWGLAYSAKDGMMYICDGYNNRIVKVNREGQVVGTYGQYGKIPGRFDFAHHMAIDSQGSLYVAEIKNWRVQKFSWQN